MRLIARPPQRRSGRDKVLRGDVLDALLVRVFAFLRRESLLRARAELGAASWWAAVMPPPTY